MNSGFEIVIPAHKKINFKIALGLSGGGEFDEFGEFEKSYDKICKIERMFEFDDDIFAKFGFRVLNLWNLEIRV